MSYFTGKKWKEIKKKKLVCTKVNYEEYSFSAKEWMEIIVQFLLLVGLVDYFCYRSRVFWVVSLPGVIWFVKWKRKQKIEKRIRILNDHFQEALRALETAVRAGYSMEQGVGECRKELEQIYGTEDTMVKEFVFMEQQIKLGVPVEQLFLDFGKRSGVEDIRNFGEIFLISRRSGGNLGQIMEKMADVIGEKIKVNRDIQTTVSGKKMEQMIMSMVPGGMILYVRYTSEGILDVLYHNLWGVLIMTLCLGMYFISVKLGRKIVRISV